MGTGSFLGVKRPGRGVDHPPQSSAEVEGRVELYISPLWAFVACSRVNFTFNFILPKMEGNKWESGCSKRSTEMGELLDKEGWKIMLINLLRL
jgi:hypothetical protein